MEEIAFGYFHLLMNMLADARRVCLERMHVPLRPRCKGLEPSDRTLDAGESDSPAWESAMRCILFFEVTGFPNRWHA